MTANLTVSAGQLIDLTGAGLKDIRILHHMSGTTSGGYVSARVCTIKRGAAYANASKAIQALQRVEATHVVTADSTAHGLSVGDIAVIVDSSVAGLNGEFLVATVPGDNQFTYIQAGANAGPGTAKVHRIPTVAYNGEGTNLKSAATNTGYDARIANFNGLIWLQVNITDGTHNVTWLDAHAGTGAQNSSEATNVVLGATSDAAVITDTTGTISGKLRGLVKWAFERMPASLGQKAKTASLPVTLASDEDPVTVVAASAAVIITPTMAAGPAAFAAGESVGALNTLTNIARANGKRVTITGVTVVDKAVQSKGLTLVFFHTTPATSTITDNAAMDISDADALNIAGTIRIYGSDYVSLVSSSVADVPQAVDLFPLAASRTLYMAIRSDEAPTYSNGDIQIVLKTQED